MTPCEKCPKYKFCTDILKDMSNAKHLCTEHPEYVNSLLIPDPLMSPSILSTPATLREYPSMTNLGFEDVLNIPDTTSLKYLNYKGNRYDLDTLECSKIILEKYVAVDYIKYLKNEGKLSLKAYNDYIDLSISIPLEQEEFDLIIKNI